MNKNMLTVILMASVLFVAGCVSNTQANGANQIEQSTSKETVDFTGFVNVDGSTAKLTLEPTGFSVVEPNLENKANEGHFHLFLDGGVYIQMSGTSYTFEDAPIGTHTLRVTVQHNDHTNRGVEKTYSFTIG